MADPKRDHVWLECTKCKSKNYREERKMRLDFKSGESLGSCMNNGKLEKNKYCPKCKEHTLHKENRKK